MDDLDDIKTDVKEQNGDSPAGWVKTDPDEDEIDDVIKFAGSEIGFLDSVLDKEVLERHSSSDEWEWEHFQYEYFDETQNFICNKARRVGLSTAFAAKAFARGILAKNQDYNAVFVSHRQEDAQQKISYVRDFLEALPPRFEKEITRNPLQLIEWKNNDDHRTKTKISSHPQKAVRGGDGDIFLDEFAHYQYDEKIWTSVINSTGMGDFSIDITSTPFGKSGKFYEIMKNEDKFPDFVRNEIYWWNCKRYLREDHDYSQDLFASYAAKMINNNDLYADNIEERVDRFGNASLKRLFRNNLEKAFRQELEAYFVDEEASFFSKDLVKSNMYYNDNQSLDHYNPRETDFQESAEDALTRDKWPVEEKYEGRRVGGKRIDFKLYSGTDKHDFPSELYSAVQDGKIFGRLVGGVDIATRKNATEFVILEEINLGDSTLQIERFRLSRDNDKDNWRLPKQKSYFENILNHGYVRKLRVDTNGIGMHLGQALEEDFPSNRFEPVELNSAKKQDREMTNLKHRFKQQKIALAYEEGSRITDLHLINRKTTDAGNIVYRASEKNKSHADYAWALALASLAGTPVGMSQVKRNNTDISEFDVKKSDADEPASAPFVEQFNEKISQKEIGGDFAGPSQFEKHIAEDIDDPGEFIDF